MNIKFRFFTPAVWGIILLPLVFAGCSLPAGVDGAGPDSGSFSRETEEDGEDSGGNQETPEEEEGGGGEDPGGEDKTPEEGGKGGENTGEENEDAYTPVPGELSIRIGEPEKPEEGAYPDLSGLTRYRLDFSREGGGTAESRYLGAKEELVLALDAGTWEIHAYGLLDRGSGQPPLAVMHGSARVTVPEGGTETVLIVPGPAAGIGEPGFLSWNITYPAEKVWGAALMVSLKIDENTVIPYTQVDINGPAAGSQKISLPPGTYRMEARFVSHNEEAGSTELVHIYPGLETGSSPVNIPETAFSDPREFSSTGDLKTYLEGLAENTGANPYPVKIAGVDLSSREKTGETLKTLYDAIYSRYVTLDLRGCTGTELLAASTYSMANRANIVSLILPEGITEINANGFSGYAALKFAVLPKVITLNTSAFKNCGNLETLFAPELKTVNAANNNSTGAFTGCTALKTLAVPRLEALGKYGLYGCEGLDGAAFPNLRTLGGLAFKGCAALKSLCLPSAARIDSGSFEDDTALAYLVFGVTPPELETNVFKGAGFPQTGVIYVPPDSVAAYKNTSLPNWSGLKELVRPLPVPAEP
jgi:hypothetical protein